MKKHILSHNNDKSCLCCGKRISAKNKFCSSSCSASYNNRGVKRFFGVGKSGSSADVLKPIMCKYCGKIFMPRSSDNVFCSSECSVNYRFDEKDKDYFNGEITHVPTLKRHYIYHNEYKCSICGINSWNDKDIVLILDHIDGNPENNLPENLRLVCPNCDSQLPTYKGRNVGNGRFYRRQRYAEGKSY